MLRGALHDVNTPMAIIQNELLEMAESGPDEPTCARAADALRQLLRLMGVVEDLHLRVLACDPGFRPGVRAFDLIALLRNKIEELEEQHPTRLIGWQADQAQLRAKGDEGVVEAVLWTLLNEVLAKTEGDIVVVLEAVSADRVVFLSVSDEGPQRTSNQVVGVLEPGDSRYGFGTGLSAAKALLGAMSGDAFVETGRGEDGQAVNVYTLCLPLAEEEA
jgi:K+-sensing histidine kinase KdpD